MKKENTSKIGHWLRQLTISFLLAFSLMQTDVMASQWRVILDEIANGSTLTKAMRSRGLSMGIWFDWLAGEPGRSEEYARAREARGEWYADKVSELAEQVVRGEVDPHAARVAADSWKWIAAKLYPKTYGEHRNVAVAVTIGQAQELPTAQLESLARKVIDGEYLDVTPPSDQPLPLAKESRVSDKDQQ